VDPFQLLIIAIIIFLSLLEGIAGRRRKAQRPGSQRPAPRSETTRPVETAKPEPSGGPTSAEDLVPADLWAVLTGEQRAPREEPAGRAEPLEAPTWERAAEETSRDALPEAITLERVEARPQGRAEGEAQSAEIEGRPRPLDVVTPRESLPRADRVRRPSPVRPVPRDVAAKDRAKRELERRARERSALGAQLEATVQAKMQAAVEEAEAEGRHLALHERLAPALAAQPRKIVPTARAAALVAALRQPADLRRAFILKEVLDAPVSLREHMGPGWED